MYLVNRNDVEFRVKKKEFERVNKQTIPTTRVKIAMVIMDIKAAINKMMMMSVESALSSRWMNTVKEAESKGHLISL